MSSKQRSRRDPRREATRSALIEAAESLFAEAGVDGVSTRQIGAAIGSLNTNVVAYHFGDKESLIEAVYRHRLPEIDRRRGQLLDEADLAGTCMDLTLLVRILAQPFLEQVDARGQHTYARFVAGLERSGLSTLRGKFTDDFPATERLIQRIAAFLPDGGLTLLHTRLRLVTALLSSSLLMIDREAANPGEGERLFDDAVAMAATALAAPFQPEFTSLGCPE
ncbi:TetR/AcrR family transcriptional regulator [Novosphingobium malaysiense]|uniref:TetR/AcrR family transcriptional regulator n=1 Tax=Novosphingobium malaysiense TaxID=1348853 RepID=UPI0006919266|nr:TetR/AcrR family transcriptional regulator [Novosphingobium malaysiense]